MLKLGFVEETDPEVNPVDVVSLLPHLQVNMRFITGILTGAGTGIRGYPYSASSTATPAADPYYYYPWYPYTSYYTYQSGSVLMEMVDVARIDPEVEEIPIIWAGIVNGVLETSQTSVKNRLSNALTNALTSPLPVKIH